MVDLDCSAGVRKAPGIIMPNPEIRIASSSACSSPRRLASPRLKAPASTATAAKPSAADVAAYEQYLRLPELSALWTDSEFPEWTDEGVLRPALQGLEITFRFASLVLSDHRPYTDRRLWTRRVEGLAATQVQLIADLVAGDEYDNDQHAAATENERPGSGSSRSSSTASLSATTTTNTDLLRGAPVTDLRCSDTTAPSSPTSAASCSNLVSRARSSEVWKLPGEAPVVSRTSEESLLPLLATWGPSKPLASRILDEIEAQFKGARCPFTLGVGEPNLEGKPVLRYDDVCRPAKLHAIKLAKGALLLGETNKAMFTAHQIIECWAQVARHLLRRIGQNITTADSTGFSSAVSDCWALERVWKLLAEIEDLHLLLDTDDFLRLKAQLAISGPGLCFRSTALAEAARESRELRHHVPSVLGAEADPTTGGTALMDAAMDLFRRRGNPRRIHILQAFQAVDAAVKKFFFAYRQVVVAVMGSLEVDDSMAAGGDPLSQVFMEPPYCPSIDAAKTFLADHYTRRQQCHQHQAQGRGLAAKGAEKSAKPSLTLL